MGPAAGPTTPPAGPRPTAAATTPPAGSGSTVGATAPPAAGTTVATGGPVSPPAGPVSPIKAGGTSSSAPATSTAQATTARNERSSAELPRRIRVGAEQFFTQLLLIEDVDQRRVDVLLRRPRHQDVNLADRLRLDRHHIRQHDAGRRVDRAAVKLVTVIGFRVDKAPLRRGLRGIVGNRAVQIGAAALPGNAEPEDVDRAGHRAGAAEQQHDRTGRIDRAGVEADRVLRADWRESAGL